MCCVPAIASCAGRVPRSFCACAWFVVGWRWQWRSWTGRRWAPWSSMQRNEACGSGCVMQQAANTGLRSSSVASGLRGSSCPRPSPATPTRFWPGRSRWLLRARQPCQWRPLLEPTQHHHQPSQYHNQGRVPSSITFRDHRSGAGLAAHRSNGTTVTSESDPDLGAGRAVAGTATAAQQHVGRTDKHMPHDESAVQVPLFSCRYCILWPRLRAARPP